MIPVNISGTFSKDDRPNNGLEAIAADLISDELTPRVVVAVIVPHSYSRTVGHPLVPTVRFAAIEVAAGADAVTVRDMIDRIRAGREQRPLQASLFDPDAGDGFTPAGGDSDGDSGAYDGDGFARPAE